LTHLPSLAEQRPCFLQTKLAAQLASSTVHTPSQRSRHSPTTPHDSEARQLSAVATQASPANVHLPSDAQSPAQLSAVATHLPFFAVHVPCARQLGDARHDASVATQRAAFSEHSPAAMQLIELVQCALVRATHARPSVAQSPHFAHATEASHPSALALPNAWITHCVAISAVGGSSHSSAGPAGAARQAGAGAVGAGGVGGVPLALPLAAGVDCSRAVGIGGGSGSTRARSVGAGPLPPLRDAAAHAPHANSAMAASNVRTAERYHGSLATIRAASVSDTHGPRA
jgi:hypothetical protein